MPLPHPLRCLTGLALVLSLSACTGESPPPPRGKPEVTVVTLQPEAVTLTRELPGRVSPFLVAEVRPQVGGLVRERLFEEGSRVEAGQPLYQLDDASWRADVESARAALKRAQATLQAARLRAARAAELAAKKLIAAQDNETAAAELATAQADVGVARAELERREVNLSYARILAPIGGRIGKSSVTQGALVTANQDSALATIQQLDPIYVDLTQSSAELLQLRKQIEAGRLDADAGLPVRILLEDGSPYPHDGRLAFTDLSVDPATGSYALRVEVANPDELLLPGMFVRAQIGLGQSGSALLVPQPAVQRDAKGGAFVWVVGADGKVARRDLKVSRTLGDRWLVDGGLDAGERVIVEG
ncbi:MAG: efflux RND transporter periplasmic adaptor subunit, partial [Rhodanobacteraceae bacterium]|nr:efflux RND transporter periplasmic adaptor subunit [Rhodanobacteraceae bacterium]